MAQHDARAHLDREVGQRVALRWANVRTWAWANAMCSLQLVGSSSEPPRTPRRRRRTTPDPTRRDRASSGAPRRCRPPRCRGACSPTVRGTSASPRPGSPAPLELLSHVRPASEPSALAELPRGRGVAHARPGSSSVGAGRPTAASASAATASPGVGHGRGDRAKSIAYSPSSRAYPRSRVCRDLAPQRPRSGHRALRQLLEAARPARLRASPSGRRAGPCPRPSRGRGPARAGPPRVGPHRLGCATHSTSCSSGPRCADRRLRVQPATNGNAASPRGAQHLGGERDDPHRRRVIP